MYISIYKRNYIQLYTKYVYIYSYILLSLVKLLFDTRKIIIIMRKQKMITRIIFALFLLQIINFEEIRKNCLYTCVIVYNDLYIIIYE